MLHRARNLPGPFGRAIKRLLKAHLGVQTPPVCLSQVRAGRPFLSEILTPPSPPLSIPDFPGRPEDPADAAARGEGLDLLGLLSLREPAQRLRGLRLPQREALPVPGRNRLHLPDQQQRLPLGLTRPRARAHDCRL